MPFALAGNNLHHIVFTNTTINGTGKDPVTRDVPADVYGGFGIDSDASSQGMTFNEPLLPMPNQALL